jgi:hypothetical protein
MYSRFITAIGLTAGLAMAVTVPAYSAKGHSHEKANPAASTSGVGGAEGCASILDMGCNLTASEMPKMMRQQQELNSSKALAVPRHTKRPQY